MFTFERQEKILKILKKKPGVRVSDLSSSLGVSEATIRRDLNKLHETRQIQRIYGGAILAEKST